MAKRNDFGRGARQFGQSSPGGPRPSPAPAAPRLGEVQFTIADLKNLVGPALLGVCALGTVYGLSVWESTNGIYADPTCSGGADCVYWVGSAACTNGLTGQPYTQTIWVRSTSEAEASRAIAARTGKCSLEEVKFFSKYSPSSRARQRIGQDAVEGLRN